MYFSEDAITFYKTLPDDEERVTIAIPTDQNYVLDSSVFDDVQIYARCPQTDINAVMTVSEKDCLADVSSIIRISNKVYLIGRNFVGRK